MTNRNKQHGGQLVEFAIVGLVFFIVTFGVVEFARALYIWNALTEATRRGARIAAVCPVNDPAIANVTVFDTFDGALGTSPIAYNLTTGNVSVNYLDATGTILPAPTTAGTDIAFVQVSITGYTLTLYIPSFGGTITTPSFLTTLPAESLGAVPTFPGDPPPPDGTPFCYFETP